MPNYNSIEGNVLFPTIDGYDMYKAGDMALYLAHCDFYPFKPIDDIMSTMSYESEKKRLDKKLAKQKAFENRK